MKKLTHKEVNDKVEAMLAPAEQETASDTLKKMMMAFGGSRGTADMNKNVVKDTGDLIQ